MFMVMLYISLRICRFSFVLSLNTRKSLGVLKLLFILYSNLEPFLSSLPWAKSIFMYNNIMNGRPVTLNDIDSSAFNFMNGEIIRIKSGDAEYTVYCLLLADEDKHTNWFNIYVRNRKPLIFRNKHKIKWKLLLQSQS